MYMATSALRSSSSASAEPTSLSARQMPTLARGIDRLAVDVVLQLEAAENPPGDVCRFGRVCDPVKKDGELVAAEPGDGVRRAHGFLKRAAPPPAGPCRRPRDRGCR